MKNVYESLFTVKNRDKVSKRTRPQYIISGHCKINSGDNNKAGLEEAIQNKILKSLHFRKLLYFSDIICSYGLVNKITTLSHTKMDGG